MSPPVLEMIGFSYKMYSNSAI